MRYLAFDFFERKEKEKERKEKKKEKKKKRKVLFDPLINWV